MPTKAKSPHRAPSAEAPQQAVEAPQPPPKQEEAHVELRGPVLHVTEYADFANLPVEPPVIEQAVEIDVTAVSSAPFNAKTRFICLMPEINCRVVFGENPVATHNSRPCRSMEYRAVPRGMNMRLSVIAED